nr:hypothetical protein [uncultured Undibacterium sp.]
MPAYKVPLLSLILFLVTAGEVLAYQNKGVEQNQFTPSVTIASTRNPVDKSYRAMVEGMMLFEKNRHLSPHGNLRFKLLPRDFDVDMSTIKLKVVGDTFSYSVPIADDQTFTLDVQDKALKEDASVRPDRRADSMTWRVEIKTPGLPQNVRRLGDLRLECRVGLTARLISTRGNNPVGTIPESFCKPTSGRSGYYFFADKPIFNVVLRNQARRMNLPLSYLYSGLANSTFTDDLSDKDSRAMIGRSYFLPLGDRSWPDDTLVEFEYMEESGSNSSSDKLTDKQTISGGGL